MNVKELIEALKEYPEDMEVYCTMTDYNYHLKFNSKYHLTQTDVQSTGTIPPMAPVAALPTAINDDHYYRSIINGFGVRHDFAKPGLLIGV